MRARAMAILILCRALCERRDHAAAATAILRGYGPELLGFLVAMQRDETTAGEAFAELSEAIRCALPRFAWESNVRTWAYAVARNVSRTLRREAGRRQRRVANPGESFFQKMAEKVRTETPAFLRTRTELACRPSATRCRKRIACSSCCASIGGLAWNELARILAETDAEGTLDQATVAKEAARLRKRFQVVKHRLREMARKEGLLD